MSSRRVLAGCLGLCLSASLAAQPPGGAATPVETAAVHERDVPAALRLVGTILADRTATVAAEVEGLIVTFGVEEGQFLGVGDVICRLDDEVARLRRDEAKALLEQRRQELAELEHGERPEEIRRLEAAVKTARALLDKAEYEKKRVDALYERQQASDKEQHDTDMDFLAAEWRLAQAQAELEKARNGPRAEVIARARYAAAAQEAVVQRLERELAKTEIRAPFTGFVVRKHTEVGEWIESGGSICDMVDIETVRVRSDVPESAIPFAVAGAPATVEVTAFGWTAAAEISRIVPLAAEAARTFPIEIDVPNDTHKLLPGMFVWTYVPAGPPGKRLMASKDAIVTRGTSKQVFVIRPGAGGGHMAVPVSVFTGLEVGGEIEVTAPEIKPGDQVVTRANERLFGPMPVDPRPAPTTQPVADAARGAATAGAEAGSPPPTP